MGMALLLGAQLDISHPVAWKQCLPVCFWVVSASPESRQVEGCPKQVFYHCNEVLL